MILGGSTGFKVVLVSFLIAHGALLGDCIFIAAQQGNIKQQKGFDYFKYKKFFMKYLIKYNMVEQWK